MPIDTSSEAWNSAEYEDGLSFKIDDFLSNNSEKAFTVGEIIDHLLDLDLASIPDPIQNAAEEGDKGPLKIFVTQILYYLYRMQHVEWRVVDGGEIYFTRGENPLYPMADHGDRYPTKFNNLEEKIESLQEKNSGLENRIARINSRLHELEM